MSSQHILTSVVSYPDRGEYGNSLYRGNCSGLLIADLLKYYLPKNVLDPMEGSGTCRDVCRKMKISYTGTDLSQGINMYSKAFLELVLPRRPFDFIFWHPPYGDMIRYSDNPKDLSTLPIPEFRLKMLKGARLLYSILRRQGHLVILIGTLRRQGRVFRFNVDLINWKEPTEPEIIKIQHNCTSNKTDYSGKFIPIVDERILIWQKS